MNRDTVSVLEGNTFVVGRRNGDVRPRLTETKNSVDMYRRPRLLGNRPERRYEREHRRLDGRRRNRGRTRRRI